MPAIPNVRQENYAQALARGTKQIDAYVGAGYKPDRGSATKLAQSAQIAKRVSELVEELNAISRQARQKATAKLALTEEWIIERMMWNAERCLRGQPELVNGVQTGRFVGKPDSNTARAQLADLAKVKGMMVDRHEFGAPGSFAALSDDDLNTKIAEMGEKLGISPSALAAMKAGTTQH